MDVATYDPAWEAIPAGRLTSTQLLAVALHRAQNETDPIARTVALVELSRAVSHPQAGLVVAAREALTDAVNAAIGNGATVQELATRTGWTPKRIEDAKTGNAAKRAARSSARAKVALRRASVRDEVTRSQEELRQMVLESRANARAIRGRQYLERFEAGETATALALEAGVSRQELTAWMKAAKAARTTT